MLADRIEDLTVMVLDDDSLSPEDRERLRNIRKWLKEALRMPSEVLSAHRKTLKGLGIVPGEGVEIGL